MAVALDILAYNEQEAEVSTTSTTYQDFVTVTFTPSQEEPVIIVASGMFRIDPDNYYARMQIEIDGSVYIDQASDPLSTGEHWSWGAALREVLDASSHTIKITYSTNNALGTCYAKYGSLLVIRDAASASSQGINEDEDLVHFYEI